LRSELEVAIVIYAGLAIEFVYRFHNDRPFRGRLPEEAVEIGTPSETSNSKAPGKQFKQLDMRLRLMMLGLAISTLFLFIR
jgi:hypothetical protein